MSKCEFCTEFSRDGSIASTLFTVLFPKREHRVLFESPNFVIVPSLGQIVEGYLLIITKEHYPSMGHLPPQLYAELLWTIERTCDILRTQYGCSCVQFEHGPVNSRQRGPCCIDHAHLHLVPMDLDLVSTELQLARTSTADDYPKNASEYIQAGLPYLYVKAQNGGTHSAILMDASDLPSQYMRRILANAAGKPHEWDWALSVGTQELESCLDTLGPEFAKLEILHAEKCLWEPVCAPRVQMELTARCAESFERS